MFAAEWAVLDHYIGYPRDRPWDGDRRELHIGVHCSILEDHVSRGLLSIAEYSEAAHSSHICVPPESKAAPAHFIVRHLLEELLKKPRNELGSLR